MNIEEFKQQNPAYRDVPNEELARKLHAKFYSQVPYDEFAAQVLPSPKPEGSFLGDVGKLLARPGEVMVSEAKAGLAQAGEAYRKPLTSLKDIGSGIMGAARVIFSPYTGLARGLVGEPAQNIASSAGLPDLPSRIVGSTAESLALLALPGGLLDRYFPKTGPASVSVKGPIDFPAPISPSLPQLAQEAVIPKGAIASTAELQRIRPITELAQESILPKKPGFQKTAEDLIREHLDKASPLNTVIPREGEILKEVLPKGTKSATPVQTITLEAVQLSKPMMTKDQVKSIQETVGPKIAKEMQATKLNVDTTQRIITVAENIVKAKGIARDPNIPITIQIAQIMEKDPTFRPVFRAELEATGATEKDFAQLFTATSSDAGRTLGQLGNLVQRMGKVPGLEDLADTLAKAQPPLTGWELAGHYWTRFVNIWRGSLVTALSTAVRNLETQMARVGLEPIEKAVDGSIRSIFRLGPASERGLSPAIADTMTAFQTAISKGKRAQVNEIVAAFPEETSELFYRYSADVANSTRTSRPMTGIKGSVETAFTKAEAGVNLFNVFNRTQEYFVRKIAFRVKLSEILRQKGMTLDNADLKLLDPKDIESATNSALEMTFAANPKGYLGKHILALYDNPFGKTLSFIAPFPRFMYNSWKFVLDRSPLALVKLLSPAERARIAGGDVATLSKAMIGSGLLFSAYELRNSKYAGERWYEIKVGDKRYDMRPFAPFSSYLFLAEMMKAGLGKSQTPLQTEELVQGIFSGNFRAGAGLYMLDGVQEMISGLISGADKESAKRNVQRFLGEVTSGFVQPAVTFRELYSDYGRYSSELAASALEEAKIRDRGDQPFLGPIKAKLPFASQTLPEFESPTQAATPQSGPTRMFGVPVSRQFSGLSEQKVNVATAETRRLGFTASQVRGQNTGIPEANRLLNHYMGPIAEVAIDRLASNPYYQKVNFTRQRLLMKKALEEIRAIALQQLKSERPDLYSKIVLKKQGPEVRELIKTVPLP